MLVSVAVLSVVSTILLASATGVPEAMQKNPSAFVQGNNAALRLVVWLDHSFMYAGSVLLAPSPEFASKNDAAVSPVALPKTSDPPVVTPTPPRKLPGVLIFPLESMVAVAAGV